MNSGVRDRVVVVGARGQLGRRVVAQLAARTSADVTGLSREDLDVTRRELVHAALEALRPRWVVNCAAMTAVDACEHDPEGAARANMLAVRWLVEAASAVGARVCTVSTDYVFDGTAQHPYTEVDQPNPRSVYGRTKLAGERELRPGIDACVRTAWLMSADDNNMLATIDRLRREPGPLRFVDDQRGSPTSADDVAAGIVAIVRTQLSGVVHLVNQGEASWFEVARFLLAAFGDDPERVEPIETAALARRYVAPRPAYSVLGSVVLAGAGLREPGPWQEALGRAVSERVGG